MATRYQLAQINIGRAKGDTTDPVMAEFMAALPEINAIADSTPGFVWRLETEDGDATAVRPYGDDLRIMMNMSVWQDLESLRGYVFNSAHTAYMKRRREWFERFEKIYVALWWVPAGHRPTVAEAVERLEHLQAHGPTPYAFTFKNAFDPQGAPLSRDRVKEDDACPA
jgi:hypothetical protein